MHNHYIINETVEFHPATGTLRDLNQLNNVVVLNSPASRCLLLLIEKAGTIVTQNEFLENVWEQRGIHVAASTFYQNISILRKGLKQIGFIDDIVVTIPRIGLILASTTHIKKLTTEQQLEISHENAHFIDEQSLTQGVEAYDIKETEGDVDNIAYHSRYKFKEVKYLKQIVKSLSRLKIILFIITMVSLLLFINTFLSHNFNDGSDYFSSYRLLKTYHGCHIFISNTTLTSAESSYIFNSLKKIPEDCKNYPWVYVSHLPFLPRISIIRCDSSMNESNTCLSDYLLDGE